MNEELFINQLSELNRNPENRKKFTEKLLNHENFLSAIFSIISENKNTLGSKAARALELVCIKDSSKIFRHLNHILILAENAKEDAIVRPMAKILERSAIEHESIKNTFRLTQNEIEKIIAICFDWMITPQKVAPQAYSMQTLYILGKEQDWVHAELALILEQNYTSGSAGYKARSRKILQKIAST
ncbi:hypothetical protein [Mesonia aquimarina]|uniref:hypothetical protein n=1 Tax=Mesonia aquimarina TaxID=1504967 RepID=UPI000EF5A875|nr:hypothetical protein [Mesonia aquimarina]